MAIRPAVGSSTPRIILIVVVLPAPLGPKSPTISPADTWKEIRSTARREPKDLARRSTERTGDDGRLISARIRPGVATVKAYAIMEARTRIAAFEARVCLPLFAFWFRRLPVARAPAPLAALRGESRPPC